MIECYLTQADQVPGDFVCGGPDSNGGVIADASDDIHVDRTVLGNGDRFGDLTAAFRAVAVDFDYEFAASSRPCRQPGVECGVFFKVVRFKRGDSIQQLSLLGGVEFRIATPVI